MFIDDLDVWVDNERLDRIFMNIMALLLESSRGLFYLDEYFSDLNSLSKDFVKENQSNLVLDFCCRMSNIECSRNV